MGLNSNITYLFLAASIFAMSGETQSKHKVEEKIFFSVNGLVNTKYYVSKDVARFKRELNAMYPDVQYGQEVHFPELIDIDTFFKLNAGMNVYSLSNSSAQTIGKIDRFSLIKSEIWNWFSFHVSNDSTTNMIIPQGLTVITGLDDISINTFNLIQVDNIEIIEMVDQAIRKKFSSNDSLVRWFFAGLKRLPEGATDSTRLIEYDQSVVNTVYSTPFGGNIEYFVKGSLKKGNDQYARFTAYYSKGGSIKIEKSTQPRYFFTVNERCYLFRRRWVDGTGISCDEIVEIGKVWQKTVHVNCMYSN